jgi:hypothetical protein
MHRMAHMLEFNCKFSDCGIDCLRLLVVFRFAFQFVHLSPRKSARRDVLERQEHKTYHEGGPVRLFYYFSFERKARRKPERVDHVQAQWRNEDLKPGREGSVAGSAATAGLEESHWLCPIEDGHRLDSSREGMVEGFSQGDYLLLIDHTAQLFRAGKAVLSREVADHPPVVFDPPSALIPPRSTFDTRLTACALKTGTNRKLLTPGAILGISGRFLGFDGPPFQGLYLWRDAIPVS